MRKLIVVFTGILVCGLFCASNNYTYAANVQITSSGSNLEITSGKNRFIAEVGSDYKENLRVYGVNEAPPSEWSPMAYASYILVAGPFTGNTIDCERNDAQRSITINVIVENKDVASKFKQLAAMQGRRRAVLIGKEINIVKFDFEGKDHSDSLRPQGRLDPRKALLIKDIIDVRE